MVHVAKTTIRLPLSPDQLVSLVSTPSVFIQLWPYLEHVEGNGRRVTLVLSRFGFRMRVTYDVDVLVDRGAGIVIYRCTSRDKLFEVRVRVTPTSDGSEVEVEASYSGPYESLSQPLLNRFVREVVEKLHSIAVQPVTAPAMPTTLKDPTLTARIIIHGEPVATGTVSLRGEEDVVKLMRQLSEQAGKAGGVVLVRLSSQNGCIRILFNNGELVDLDGEIAGQKVNSSADVDKLLELLRGSWRYILLKAPSQ